MGINYEHAYRIVDSVRHRDGWELHLELTPHGYRLWIDARVRNSRFDALGGDRMVGLSVPRYAPEEALEDEEVFLHWVLYEVLWVALHEEIEWFRDRATMHPIVDPHDAEHTATRLLPPRPGEEWWTK